ncbi:AMP-binding protein [Pseudoalteromonas sp. S16_S37]|uniref:AMP-binding protein n=1 Tax=Pseudoalteromonas sp. S16_S37 TaxID=2720228 RepID=UPI0016801B9F|nr:AMP-binding protein [Pseudoalteromonas sp. S16_S37]MBD1582829.1 AMP-binding protein [Pseudoalteromonas sp. S16_S37]
MKEMLPTALHQALFYWANKQPQHPFLLAEPALCYRQSANYVSALATQLSGSQRVAIWLEKNNHYALSILATLSAGACYIPIDSKQPINRVDLILTDAQADTLIVDDKHLLLVGPLLAKYPQLKVVLIGEKNAQQAANTSFFDWRLHLETEQAHASEPWHKNSLAAVLFTSGSTGRPKGVQLTLGNIQHFVSWCQNNMSLDCSDRFLNLASFNFDLSTFDLFVCLAVGGSLYIANDDAPKQPMTLANVLSEHQITVMYCVPSLLNLMNRIGLWQQAEALALQHLIFAGEVMPKPCLKGLASALPNTHFYNFYGPTETNVCLAYKVTEEDILNNEPIAIGLPIGDTQAWLIDEQGNPVTNESGAMGELVIQGSCVTPGYCLESQKLANHALQIHSTGDIARYHNGQYYYHGRCDRMVKISGFRVELGEIEACLLAHPQISEVAVRYCANTSKLIASYALNDAQSKLGTLALKTYSAQHLPTYMIPHKFECFGTLPKNANGKIDYPTLAQVNDE